MSDLGGICEPARARSGRTGGRQARVAMRAAPLADDVRPVRGGLPGGTYKPLTDAGMAKIHQSALEALEVIGLSNAPSSGVEILTGAGAILGDDGRIRFPRVDDKNAGFPRGRQQLCNARNRGLQQADVQTRQRRIALRVEKIPLHVDGEQRGRGGVESHGLHRG